MKLIAIAAFLILCPKAHASVAINNAVAVNVSVSTPTPSNTMIDLAQADSASWQMNFSCATGSATIQQSNDGVNWVDINVTGSSITFQQSNLGTSNNNLYAISNPSYRYVNFKVTNSSSPVNNFPSPATPCTFKATQLLKSVTVKSN